MAEEIQKPQEAKKTCTKCAACTLLCKRKWDQAIQVLDQQDEGNSSLSVETVIK